MYFYSDVDNFLLNELLSVKPHRCAAGGYNLILFIANKDFRSAINDFLGKEVDHINLYANELDERSPFKK